MTTSNGTSTLDIQSYIYEPRNTTTNLLRDLIEYPFEDPYSTLVDILDEKSGYLEYWYEENKIKANRENYWFWVLKMPTILASSFAGLFSWLDLKVLSLILGCIGSVCAAIDTTAHHNTQRDIYNRSCNDIKLLQTKISTYRGNLALIQDETTLRAEGIRILGEIDKEIQHIVGYINQVESIPTRSSAQNTRREEETTV